ncbi:unnamed protein product [Menidia menidia]|uniref:Nuclear pore complex protein Nup153 n=1 Tax=Menidia menidia TaxID=238744 RepID=A0A8S4ATW6_9TELE|nr:unnamed protein product [Menidia menidia]
MCVNRFQSTLSSSTLLSSSHLGDSPFYPGKTTYGGAAAVRSSRTRPGTPYQVTYQHWPANVPTSKTASLPQLWSPEMDRTNSGPQPSQAGLKKPSFNLSVFGTSSNVSIIHKRVAVNSLLGLSGPLWASLMDSALPPVQKLVVPSVASFSSNRAVSFRPTLTPGGPGRALDRPPREKTVSSGDHRPTLGDSIGPTRQSPQLPEASPGPSQSTTGFGGPAYPLSSTPAISLSSGGGKIKRERSSMRPSKRAEEDERDLGRLRGVVVIVLWAAGIKARPGPPGVRVGRKDTARLEEKEATEGTTSFCTGGRAESIWGSEKDPPKASTPPSAPFTFSSPIVKATAHSPPSYSPSTGFTFSAPVAKLGPSLSNGKLSAPTAAPGFSSAAPLTAPGPDSAPPALLPPPSLPSPAGGFGGLLKPSSDWSCDVCLVSNKQSDAKCPEGSWDCDTCLVRNKMEAVKCVACETAKPGTGLKPSLTFPSAFSAVKTVSAPTAPVSTGFAGFGDKFKKPEGAWESAAEVSSSAPAFGLGDKFKKPEGAWDCDVCLVQNKAADLQCPSVLPLAPPGPQDRPRLAPLLREDLSLAHRTVLLLDLEASSSAPPIRSGFKFGVPSGNASSEPTSKDTTSSSGFKFGGSSEGFKFGTSSDDKKSEQPTDNSGFKFGASGGIVFGTGSSTSTETNSSKGGFTFGLSKPEEKPSESVSSSSSSVRFNSPSPSQEKTENALSSNEGVSSNPKPNPKGSVFSRLGEPIPSPGTLKEPATPVFSFGKPEKKEEKKEAGAVGAPPPAPSGFLFGGSGKEADAPPPPAFAFGKPAEKSEAPPAAFSFGQSAAGGRPFPSWPITRPPPPRPPPPPPRRPACVGQRTAAALQRPPVGPPPPRPPPAQAPPSSFVFGQPSSSSSSDAPAKTFVFGQTQDSQPSAPPTAAPPFIFGAPPAGAPPASTTTAAPSFAFGATAPPAASSAAPSAAPSPFVFSPAPSGGFQTPSFGSTFGSPFTATASPSPAFGAKPNAAAPVFAQQTNSTPVFGAASSTPGGGFQFGGAGGFGASSPAPSGVFTFGAGSAKSFAASPAGPPQAIAGRKIKTAVRRRK